MQIIYCIIILLQNNIRICNVIFKVILHDRKYPTYLVKPTNDSRSLMNDYWSPNIIRTFHCC